ncbi:helix-turn-helix transcriptional regulator [Halovulum sp. GXIMD14794]
MANPLYKRPEVEQRTGLSRSSIYEKMRLGEFPRPVRIGKRAVAWRADDVDGWIESREVAA